MNVALLTNVHQNVGIIKESLQQEQCECSILLDLCMLEKDARCRVLDCLLVDKDYMNNNENDNLLRLCLGVLNNKIPIVYFDTQYFKPAYKPKDNARDTKISALEKVFDSCQKKVDSFHEIFDKQLRPSEKKLYNLLKKSNDESISLEEMSIFLWGNSNKAHTNTLYSYIHRIKHILQEGNQNIEWLIKEKKGYYKISYGKDDIL